MLTFLPVALALLGRWVFWPRVPHVDQAVRPGHARHVGPLRHLARPPRRGRAWIGATVVLLRLRRRARRRSRPTACRITDALHQLPRTPSPGQQIYDAKFAQGHGRAGGDRHRTPTPPTQVIAAAAAVAGRRRTAPGSVCVQPDYAKLAAAASRGARRRRGGPARPAAARRRSCRCSRSTAGPWSTPRSPTGYDTPGGARPPRTAPRPRCTPSPAPTPWSAARRRPPWTRRTPRGTTGT